MKKNIIKISIFFVLSVVFTFSLLNNKTDVNAAEATISVSLSSSDIKIGDEFTVTVTCNSNASMAFLQWNFTYPTSKLKHIPLEGQSESSGVINAMLDFSQGDIAKTVSVKYKFKAVAVGLVEFNLKDVENYRLETGSSDVIETEVKGASVTITEKNKSNDANLKAIKGFKGDKIFEPSPAFNKDITDYKITVPSNYDVLYLSYTKSDPDASVTISEDEFLDYGNNKRVITVVAPDGTTKKYNVNVYREPATPVPPTATPTARPTIFPTETPPVETLAPTVVPTETPTPTVVPTETPTPTIPAETEQPTELPSEEPTFVPGMDNEGDVCVGQFSTEPKVFMLYDIEKFFEKNGGVDDFEFVDVKIGDVYCKGIPLSDASKNSVFIIYACPEGGTKDLYCYDTFDGSFQRSYVAPWRESNSETPSELNTDSVEKDDNDDSSEESRHIGMAVVAVICAIAVILALVAVVLLVLSRNEKKEEDFEK